LCGDPIENNQRRAVFGLAKGGERVGNARKVVGIGDVQHVPMVGGKARGDVFGEGDTGLAIDGDVIVVVNPTKIIEAEMTGKRGRLGADALHQVAVAANGVNIIIEDI
jgi:hypothetical protein